MSVGNCRTGNVTQIGSLALYNGYGWWRLFVNGSANPSIYTFAWGGGFLDIVGEVGNNGSVPNGIDMEFDTTSGTLIGDDSLYFPW